MRVMRMLAVVASAALVLGVVLPAVAQGGPSGPGGPGPGQTAPGGPGYGPGGPGFGPGYGPGQGPGFHRHGGMRGFGRGERGAGPWLWVGGLFALLRLLLLVGVILLLWRLLTAPWWGRFDPAKRVVRERFARGEISEEEYQKRLTTLA